MNTYVAQVRDAGVYMRTELFVKGHAPETVVLEFASSLQLLPKAVRRLNHKDAIKRVESQRLAEMLK